jgi:hypothetical protein
MRNQIADGLHGKSKEKTKGNLLMTNVIRKIRWYQQEFHKALVGAKHDRLIEIAHRRWG